ncbi:MAG: aromatic compound degradation protein PaaI, partial [Rhodospirillaceae bacterium]|nr:aromatic compound degradation protein PaaI [Rhodospirillaceae bacterium]
MSNRSRTYTWADPDENAEAGQTMAGIDFLRAMR